MNNQLEVIVKESGLESTKAQVMLEKFQSYFEIAAEWEGKAKAIVVTDANQKPEMEMARVGRLFLREKRIAIEKTRKELKEQALREGKAIDGIANVLKALIVPIEEHLDRQEHFVEIKAKEAERQRVLEAERGAEEERIAQEKAEAEERERIRLENERLKREIEKQAKILAEQKAKGERERKVLEETMQRERKELQTELSKQIECPFCHNKFTLEEANDEVTRKNA